MSSIDKMDDAYRFVKCNVYELAVLLKVWNDTGKLGGGKRCLVDELVDKLPVKSYMLAKVLINDVCLDIVIDRSVDDQLTDDYCDRDHM